MYYQNNNLEVTQDELQECLKSLKESYFSKYEVNTHTSYITVKMGGATIDIRAEFEVQSSGEDFLSESGDIYKRANLTLEVMSQSWRTKNLNELDDIRALTKQVYQAMHNLKVLFGYRDVYVLVSSKEDQDKRAKQVSQTELSNVIQDHVRGMRLSAKKKVTNLVLPLASKAKITPDFYTIPLGGRDYTVTVDKEKNLDITRTY